MSTDFFYVTLPTLDHFLDVTRSSNFFPVPDDWYVLITDIANSTQAVADGQYKTVNFLGASSIMAVLNAIDHQEVPFVFGGDGASILVPPSVLEPARQALVATRQQALDSFGMNLRVGVVPVQVIRAEGYQLKVAKVRVTEHYSQASFTGGGLTYAAQLVKDDTNPNPYRLDTYQASFKADFSGLECRWQDIPSYPGHTLSLIVSTNGVWPKSSDAIYAEVLGKIQTIFGGENGYHPVKNSSLNLSFNFKELWIETKMRSPNRKQRLFYLIRLLLENLLGYVLMGLKIKIGNTDWGRYKQAVSAATDYQKFDDILRMVISSSADHIEQLTEYLERRFKAGELVYGLHISDSALITCLVFERDGHHTHFVDGADGGYTLAAQAFKQRMHQKASNRRTSSRFAKLRNLSSFHR